MKVSNSQESLLVKSESPPSFERAPSKTSSIWKKIHSNPSFARQLQVGVFAASVLVLPVVLIVEASVLAITALAVVALGVTFPVLCNKKLASVWRGTAHKIQGIVADVIALPKAVLTTYRSFRPSRIEVDVENRDKNRPIVVFVHGFLHNKSYGENAQHHLVHSDAGKNAGITEKDIYSINLGAPVTTEGVDYYARVLATKLEQIRDQKGLGKDENLNVIFCAHSMGGLVSAQFSAHYADATSVKVKRLIANGTPWHGTIIANTMRWLKACQDMLPSSDFHQGLVEHIKPLKERLFVIATKGDTIVPFASAKGENLEIPEENRRILENSWGHLSMLESKESLQLCSELIAESWNLED